MTLIRLIDNNDNLKLMAFETNATVPEVEKIIKRLLDALGKERTVKDFIKHLRQNGHTFKEINMEEVYY